MGFTKLHNPKAWSVLVPPEGVLVSCRELKRKAKKGGGETPKPPAVTRFAVVRIGAVIARKAGLAGAKRASILIGDGLERRRCGIAVDDKTGEFTLRQLKTGDFQLTIPQRAAAGILRLDVPRFAATAELVPIAAGMPHCIMFDLSAEMREAGTGTPTGGASVAAPGPSPTEGGE